MTTGQRDLLISLALYIYIEFLFLYLPIYCCVHFRTVKHVSSPLSPFVYHTFCIFQTETLESLQIVYKQIFRQEKLSNLDICIILLLFI